jgi:hypothetical protein
MARLYQDDFTAYDVYPENGIAFTLAELRRLIGPALTVLRAPRGRFLVINERGPAMHLPPNHAVTLLLGDALGPNSFVAGAALLCDGLEVGES